MERTYTTAAACLISALLAAQVHTRPVRAAAGEKHAGIAVPPMKGDPGAPKGASYYNEAWDSGLDGWTIVSGVGNLDWTWTNTGPGPTTSTYPVPPLNTSTPSGWMIIDDDYSGTSGVQAESSIVSPVIDLSGAPPNLKIEFDQYFQEFDNDFVETAVGVSTDGGFNWDEVFINDGVGRDGRPNPELVDLDISPWVAVNPANVQLRFRYKATWDYGWQVDNVTIKELPNNDMAVLSAYLTDFDFNLTGLANIEYSVYAQEQTRPMIMGGVVKNKGYLPQTNVQLDATVNDPGGGSTELNSAIYDAVPGQQDSVAVQVYTPGALGTYDVGYAVTQSETDEAPSNNAKSRSFAVDACVWAQDDGVMENRYSAGGANEGEQTELGNYFDVANAGSTLYGIAVAIADSTPVGTLIYGVVYDINGDQVAQTPTEYVVQASDLNSPGDSKWILLQLEDPLPLDEATAYLVMVGGYGGPDQVSFSTSGASAPQVSLIHYPNIVPPDDYFYVTRTPMVRALLGESCMGMGIAENAGLVQNASFYPNPFAEEGTLSFVLGASANMRLEVRDVTGRLVIEDDLGRLSAGNHTRSINGAGLSAGTYTWSLIADGARLSGVIARDR